MNKGRNGMRKEDTRNYEEGKGNEEEKRKDERGK